VASTHSYLLIFTDKGKVYWLKVHELPQGSRQSRGKPVVNLIKISKDEKIAAVLPIREFQEGHFLVFATAKGYIKKTDMMAFAAPRSSGLIALSIDDDDSLINVAPTTSNDDIVIGTRMGMAIRFKEEDVRPMGRTARGVRAIKLKKDGDAVVGMVIPQEEAHQILTVCDNGYGKRTEADDYRIQGRSGSGIISLKISDKTGMVSGVVGVCDSDQLMVITNNGVMIRTNVAQISVLGRATQGVRIINIDEGDSVASLARVSEPEETQLEGEEGADVAVEPDATASTETEDQTETEGDL
jgi:DNA gyrase subunit A